MIDILTEIVANKRKELEQLESLCPLEELRAMPLPVRKFVSMKASLRQSHSGIIAEFKRKSPSKGWINEAADAKLIPPAYEAEGASALSILTDSRFFGGSLEDIRTVREKVALPILRKDFIISEYQLYEAVQAGADAVLLIAACLDLEREYIPLLQKAHELGLEVLLEVHSEKELVYAEAAPDMVGVNNRNLGTFITDVENSFRLAARLPKDTVLVSESGISQPQTVKQLRHAGFNGFLIGECFMREEQPATALSRFIAELNSEE